MPTPNENEILKIIDDEGGETKEIVISRAMGFRLDYLRSILSSMGRRDIIDVFRNGKVRIARKGWQALGKTPKFKTPWENF